MKTSLIVLSTLAAVAVVGAVRAYAFVNSGLYDVSASTPDSGLVYWATHQTMEHSVARRMEANIVPAGLDAQQKIAKGGQIYVDSCAVCHGRPGVDPVPSVPAAPALNGG